jgi:ParB-like chromosome segregation protein Spo0J
MPSAVAKSTDKSAAQGRIVRVAVKDLRVVGARRKCNPAKVRALAESMAVIGQKTPIGVRYVDGAPVLVVGFHRLEAARSLGWEAIDAVVFEGDETDARLWQISENLHDADLTVLERAEQEVEWIRLTEARAGVSGQLVQKPKGGRPKGGVAQAARELPVPGKTDDARRKALERSQKIDGIAPEAKAAAKAAGLDENQWALLQIAKQPTPEAQVEKAQELAKPKRRGQAARPAAGEPSSTAQRKPTDLERRHARQTWERSIMAGIDWQHLTFNDATEVIESVVKKIGDRRDQFAADEADDGQDAA